MLLYGVPIISLYMEGLERLCLAQISNMLLKKFSYNEIHNRRVALGITCIQCTPLQLELLRRAGAMPITSRRCGMITRREAERLCKSFIGDNSPPRLPKDFAFAVYHKCSWGCRGLFMPIRYNSSRAKCIKCQYCNIFFTPNKFIFHSHRDGNEGEGAQVGQTKYVQPVAANFYSWRRHLLLAGNPTRELAHVWEDVKALFNGGIRKRMSSSQFVFKKDTPSSTITGIASGGQEEILETTNKTINSSHHLADNVTAELILPLWKSYSEDNIADKKSSDTYRSTTQNTDGVAGNEGHFCGFRNYSSLMTNYMYNLDSNNLFWKNPTTLLANSQIINNFYIQNNHVAGMDLVTPRTERNPLLKSLPQETSVSLSAFKPCDYSLSPPLPQNQIKDNFKISPITDNKIWKISSESYKTKAHSEVATSVENILKFTGNLKPHENILDVESFDSSPTYSPFKYALHTSTLGKNIPSEDSNSNDVFINVVDDQNED